MTNRRNRHALRVAKNFLRQEADGIRVYAKIEGVFFRSAVSKGVRTTVPDYARVSSGLRSQ